MCDLSITVSCVVNPSQSTHCLFKPETESPLPGGMFCLAYRVSDKKKKNGLPTYTQLTLVYVTFLALWVFKLQSLISAITELMTWCEFQDLRQCCSKSQN